MDDGIRASNADRDRVTAQLRDHAPGWGLDWRGFVRDASRIDAGLARMNRGTPELD